MEGANVYLSQTTLGDVSDKEGYFRISNIPPGNYILVISYVGYELYNEDISIGSGEELFIEESLFPNEELLEEIVVSSGNDRKWERNLKRFERFFIGETQNGQQTKIQNPEVLSFESDMSILTATAERELQIINNALGYEITVNLTYFIWNYLNDSGSTLYFYRFKDLKPENDKEHQRWLKNRNSTYKYSRERFLRTLIFKENRDHYTTSGGDIEFVKSESNNAYSLFDDTDQIYRFKVGIGGLNNKVTVKIDDWRVMDDTKYGYIGYNETGDTIENEMFIDQNGNLQNPLDFTFDGVWYKHRIADKLPLNFR